jgi:hypothetical protein
LKTFQDIVSKLLILLGICLVAGSVISLLSIFLVPYIFDIPLDNAQDIFNHASNPMYIGALKFIQFFNSVGLFVIPPFLYVLYIKEKPMEFLNLKKFIHIKTLIFLCLIYIISIPAMEWLITFNSNLSLPDSLVGLEQWMKAAEERAAEVTKAFLVMNGIGDLIINLIIIAIIPAIGEELLFRGVLQRQINLWSKNGHLAVWLAAFIFSAIHLQFYGFLPRLVLGALFGYFYLWSNNLWVPIIAHFINNASAVMISYYMGSPETDIQLEAMNQNGSEMYVIISLVILFLTLKRFRENLQLTRVIGEIDKGRED